MKTFKTEISKLKDEIKKLEKEASNAKVDLKEQGAPKIESLKKSAHELEGKIESLKDSTEDKWDEVKTEFDKTMISIKDNIKKSRKWLSEKIAPDA